VLNLNCGRPLVAPHRLTACRTTFLRLITTALWRIATPRKRSHPHHWLYGEKRTVAQRQKTPNKGRSYYE